MALPTEWVAFYLDEHELAVARDADASRDPYDRVIRPFQAPLGRARQVIVIADRAMQEIAFAELYDRAAKRHLIEQLPVSMALSASGLTFGAGEPRAKTVVGVVLPAANGAPDLPDAYGEVSDIEPLYAKAKRFEGNEATVEALLAEAPRADVIHIAGHTDRPDAAGDDALLFVRAGGTTERVSGKTAASLPIGRPVVVLAACESLRAAPSRRTHALRRDSWKRISELSSSTSGESVPS